MPEQGRRDKNDVFVGNIPFGTTEEQLHQIFSEAGGVVNIRLVSDFETGKPKGYAFVEYEDAATALSSIRNLNGFECNGRPLRVNFSNNSSLGAEQQRGEKAPQQVVVDGVIVADERTVKGVVMQMGAHEVYDVVSNMKQLVEKEPDKAKQMFVSHPQVAEALLHMQVRLGMLKADDVPSLQTPPPPPVVGGAIMLGKGAQLPLLVPSAPAQFQQVAPPTAYPPNFQPPPPAPQALTGQALGWGQGNLPTASQPNPPQGHYQQPLQTQAAPPRPPPPPPQQQQQPLPTLQPPQSQSSWGSNPTESKPRDPRARYNR